MTFWRRIVMAVLSLAVIANVGMAASAQALTVSTRPITTVAACGGGVVQDLFGLQPWYACLSKNDDGSPKITKLTDLLLIIFPVVEWLIKIAMYVAIFMTFYMLFKIAMARGDSSKLAGAMGGIRDAIIGLVIALVSVGIVNFISSGIAK